MPPASYSSTTYNTDGLIAGNSDSITSRNVTILAGQNLQRGAVLGRITASGKYILSLSAAGDGSQTPDAILAESIDASAGDKIGVAYFTGHFNERKVTLGTAHTAASVREGLRVKGIHLITPAQ